ncbi:MAG: hypothetical protein MK137_09780 [Rickettsiales bacterium]|nr:hypothetical protein [Rickettsiales bacterium]
MKNDFDTFKESLDDAEGIKQLTKIDRPVDITHQVWFSLYIYYVYLCFIQEYYKDESHGELLTSESDSVEPLYLVGESHTLSSANTIVKHEGSPMQCQARLVVGVKVYNLCTEGHNYFKASFEEQFNALPKRSKIVVMVGEIDCRSDGGINNYYKKNPDIDLDQYIDGMIKNYVEFILSLAKKMKHTILFYGVPACKQENVTISKNDGSTPERSEQDRINQVEIIRLFNTHLKKYAKLNNCKFLDVYNYTNDMDGTSSGIHHLDSNHLYPHVFRELF